jgi:predicted alpha-1,6-mannanase (GH76 family)
MSNLYETYRSKAATAAAILQNYYEPEQGLYVDSMQRWWQSATALEFIIDNMMLTDSTTGHDAIETTFVNAQDETKGFINDYYDDEGRWAITWIKAFDFTGDEKYLNMAKSIFHDLTLGWDDHTYQGGLWWKKPHEYKAAIQNELFLVVAARLHQRSSGDDARKYLEWAQKEWDWFNNSGMINTSRLVNNGLDDSCENDGGTTCTYNQGVILGGLVELYRITKEGRFLIQPVQSQTRQSLLCVMQTAYYRSPASLTEVVVEMRRASRGFSSATSHTCLHLLPPMITE